MAYALLTCLLLAADAGPVDAVVVAPREFLPALEPLIVHRQQQGHRFAYIPAGGTVDAIRGQIRTLAAGGTLKYVLLVGDAEPAAPGRSVPVRLERAVVNVNWGSEPQIASDHAYADLDDDHQPDLAVGRLPADSPQELAGMVAKILAYEHNTDFGPWRQRINLIAGVGGFSPLIDSLLETATTKLLTSGIPAAYETRVTYGSWRSRYCPDPRRFHATTVERHNEGCLFWVYVGHGQAHALDQVSVPGERFHIFDVRDCRELKAQGGPPIALLLACYTGAFDHPRDCLAEELLKAAGGPVAVFGGSRVTMPYGMSVLATSLMEEYFRRQPPTLGAAILAAKRKAVAPLDEADAWANLNRVLLDGLAAVVSPSRELLAEERREHLYLFNLLGDPMLRLSYPQEVPLVAPTEAVPGQRLRIAGRSETGGSAVLELVCRRDCAKQPTPSRERFDPTDRALAAYHEVYEQALDRCWARWGLELPPGEFATEVVIPPDTRGPCHLRLLVQGGPRYALGAANLYVRTEPAPAAAPAEGAVGAVSTPAAETASAAGR